MIGICWDYPQLVALHELYDGPAAERLAGRRGLVALSPRGAWRMQVARQPGRPTASARLAQTTFDQPI